MQYVEYRKKISSEYLLNASLGIANKVLDLPIWSFEFYHLFLAISDKKEIETTFILSILQGKDKNVVLPKIFSQNILKHYLLTDNTKLKKNEWGIPEPIDGIEIAPNKLDVVFVPLLAFDLRGNRVGYGKGYYDKFLSKCRKDTIKIGLSLFHPTTQITDIDKNDVRLDFCVTPDKTYDFSESSGSESMSFSSLG